MGNFVNWTRLKHSSLFVPSNNLLCRCHSLCRVNSRNSIPYNSCDWHLNIEFGKLLIHLKSNCDTHTQTQRIQRDGNAGYACRYINITICILCIFAQFSGKFPTKVNGKQDWMSRQASMLARERRRRVSNADKNVRCNFFFKFIYKVIGLHWTDGVSVQLSSGSNCLHSHSYSYGNVINTNTALPMRHTNNNNKHISFLSCTYAARLDGQLYGFIHSLRGAIQLYRAYCMHPLCFAHLISFSSYFFPLLL